MKDVECPYCGHEQEINRDDGYGYEEDRIYEQECGRCRNIFAYDTSIHFYHEAWKAPCLNGGDHNWQSNRCYPVDFTKMECDVCGEERQPTEEEWIEIEAKAGEKRGDWRIAHEEALELENAKRNRNR